ncbi:hypothetical protein ACSBR2_024114 [Camellia fascicularis]
MLSMHIDASQIKSCGIVSSIIIFRVCTTRIWHMHSSNSLIFEDIIGKTDVEIYVEPIFSNAGDTIGVNYMGMDITDHVRKRENMAKLREEIAVLKAKETELNKTIHITEETM